MSMSNYLYADAVVVHTMAASNQSVGLDHLTVIPENFEPESPSDSTAADERTQENLS